jgi:solute carrier family 45 protein 1/2/4
MKVPWLTPRRLWIISHFLFALCMFGTFFVSSVSGTIVLFSIVGISWAITTWVPYTLLSIEISQGHLPGHTGENRVIHAGTVLSLHNVAISLPQILVTLGSGFFWKLQETIGSHSDESTVWILRAGGIAALVAMYLGRKLQDPRIDIEHTWKDEILGMRNIDFAEGLLHNHYHTTPIE